MLGENGTEKFWLWMLSFENMYPQKVKKILHIFHTPEEFYYSGEKCLQAAGLFGQEEISGILKSKKSYSYDRELEKLEQQGIRFASIESPDYPKKLRDLCDAPYGLFFKGGRQLEEDIPVVAIVGARICSVYGSELAEYISKSLAGQGICVVSGMAKGIDAHSHMGALQAGGCTYAVLGTGVDICYPVENQHLYEAIAEKGCLISEYPPGRKALPWHFPARNRIVSGISDAVVVVEAREKSGSLITVEHALEQGKDVYAVPGRISDSLSQGCNRLIQSGAQLLLSPEEILESVFRHNFQSGKFFQKKKYPIAKELEVVYSNLDLFPKNVQTIIEETGETSDMVLEKLLQLQWMNLIQEPVKGYYSKKL